jgi:two-component system, chemotaxis family, response regulator Rcp1
MSTTPATQAAAEILLVEDSMIDIRLATEALTGCCVPLRLHIARNGDDALAFLHHEAPFTSAPRPTLILLDLNLPRKDGREVLTAIKQDHRLVMIPVCVLTSSTDVRDLRDVYRLGANCCITKSIDAGYFIKKVQHTTDFWLSVVQLPPAE